MTGFRKISRNVDFWPKMTIFFTILPPERGQKLRPIFFCKKVKLRVHTLLKSHYTSKLDHFWARYLQKMVKNPYYVTTCNVFLTKKGQNGQNQIFPGTFTCFFKSKPKTQFKYAKLRRSYDRISKN